jgi:hypothetical protein
MACSKYTLTNTGSTLVNFNYRRCDDSLWEYQVELNPNQTKNIWLIDNTYSIAPSFSNTVSLVNLGVFPAVSATATQTPTLTPTPTTTPTPSVTATNTQTPTQTNTGTPTNTPTPSVTQTQTQTPTNTETPTPTQTPTNTETPTQTVTPTNTETPTNTPTLTQTPTNTTTSTPTPTGNRVAFTVYSASTYDGACGQSNPSMTIYGEQSLFDQNTVFYDTISGPNTGVLTGYYNYSQTIVQLVSGNETGGFALCQTLTPTPTVTSTPTNTPTNTTTPTNTPTTTSSPTPTFAYYTYSLGTGATGNDACIAYSASPTTIYGTVAGGIGPNVGEFLYETAGIPLTDAVPNGWYSNGTATFEVTGGSGEITFSDPNGCV